MKYILPVLLILGSISVRGQTKKENFKEYLLNLRICGEMMDSVKKYNSLTIIEYDKNEFFNFDKFYYYKGRLYYFWNEFQYYFVIVFGVDMLEQMKISYTRKEDVMII